MIRLVVAYILFILMVAVHFCSRAKADEYEDKYLKALYTACLKTTSQITECKCFIKEYGKIFNDDDIEAFANNDKEFLQARASTPWATCFGNPPPPFPKQKSPKPQRRTPKNVIEI